MCVLSLVVPYFIFFWSFRLVKMVDLDNKILKCMINQNFSSVNTFVQSKFTDIKNEAFTSRKHGTYEKLGVFIKLFARAQK